MATATQPSQSFQFCGRSFLAFVLRPEIPISRWMSEADTWLSRSPGFFAGKPVVLDVSGLLLTKAKAPSSTEAAADSAAVSSLLVSAGDDRSGGALLDQVLVPAERDWLFSQAMVSTRPES